MIYTFLSEMGACLSSTVRKTPQYLFAFSTHENSEAQLCSTLDDGR